MLINVAEEDLIPLKAVCKMFPGRTGRGTSLSTVWRWIQHGRRGHKLQSLVIGGQRYTSKQAVTRFLAAINQEQIPLPAGKEDQIPFTAGQAEYAAALMKRQLDAYGL
jgi:hypothetical protein